MALQKNKTSRGHLCNYWRILQYSANFDRSDAVITFGLYKDAVTREADPNAVMESFTFDLGSGFHNLNYNNGQDTVKNIKLKEAYTFFKSLVVAEAAKPVEQQNTQLSFFSDAIDA